MKFINVLLLAFVLFSFTGCKKAEAPPTANKAEGPPAYGDTIVVGSIGDASNLIPLLASDSASHDIAWLIYNGLVRYDKNLNLEGDLAESWEVSKDGLGITFHLRKGVKWHDGADFTADDVMYTYKVTIDPKTPTAYSGDFLMLKKAEVLDKYTFRVTYPKPFAPALASWGSAILPKHLLEGKEIAKSELARHPIGTGPYKFAEWKTGEKIVLEANPEYWEGRPYIERYIYRIIPDQATLFLELKSGGVDYTGLTPLQYARQTEFAEFKKNFNKYKYLAFAYTYMGYNLTNPIFQDKRVRKAISYAIDKQELVDGVLLGLGKSATGPYKPGTWVYNDKVERYDFNPQKARELLAEAGWKDTNGDGLLDKDGKPFEFTIMTNQGNDSRAKTVEIIQKKLKEIGITVKPRVMEWASFLQRIDKKDFEAVVLGWTIGQDPDLFDIWHSSKTQPKELNFITYRNLEVDELLTKGRETFDQ
ncbi:MAG: oligopeptide-binding protein, partial [Deltaproteobacteria bacterium]|nr:oligopeptide-binding protein [Deltaproteobacteria bacterium]